MTDEELAAIEARAHAVDLPKLPAYGSMELNSPGIRAPIEHRRVVATVETLNAALDALSERCGDGRALVAEVRRLRALIKDAESDGAAESLHSSNCPWCSYAVGDWKRRHAPECPAFHEDGRVR